MDELIYTQEVLRVLGISLPTLHKIVRAGKLPPARMLNHRLAWTRAEIQDLITRLPVVRSVKKQGSPLGIERIVGLGEDVAVAAARRVLEEFEVYEKGETAPLTSASAEALAQTIRGEGSRTLAKRVPAGRPQGRPRKAEAAAA